VKIIQSNRYKISFFLVIFFFLIIFVDYFYAKTILLTGGVGFIGSHVAQALLARKDRVIIIDNFNDAYDQKMKEYNLSLIQSMNNADKDLVVYCIDICDESKIEEICKKEHPDVICHLAARAGVRTSIDDPHEYFRSNIDGTLSILEVARKCSINHVVCASSSSVYGIREDGPFCETDSVDHQSSPYGMTKRAGELITYVYHHLFNISITNLRFFTVYGPRARLDMSPFIFLNAIYNDKPITVYGDGSAIRDFTYIDDIVNGIVKAIDISLGYEIINIGRGEPIVLRDFIAIIENIVQKKAYINYIANASGDVPQTHASIEKAQSLLNYTPKTSIHNGLKNMYRWYKDEYLTLMQQRNIDMSDAVVTMFE